jgi:hypothetical protein
MTDIGLMVICIFITLCWVYTIYVNDKAKSAERQQWAVERQQLLDRIQAPSFDHLKQAEIRVIKAQKEEPPVKYELV